MRGWLTHTGSKQPRVLKELTAGVNTDRIMGDDALSQAAEARQTAVGLIGQIKTKSVRESKVPRNQIPQIDAHDLSNLRSAVTAQRERLATQSSDLDARRTLDSRLVPEFATGGVVPGPFGSRVPAFLHAGEVVLNARQQAAVGYDALADAGVPGLSAGSGQGYVIENHVYADRWYRNARHLLHEWGIQVEHAQRNAQRDEDSLEMRNLLPQPASVPRIALDSLVTHDAPPSLLASG